MKSETTKQDTFAPLSEENQQALTIVEGAIHKAAKAEATAKTRKGHTIATGIAYLIAYCKMTLAEATDRLLEQNKEANRDRKEKIKANIRGFNHLIPAALSLLNKRFLDHTAAMEGGKLVVPPKGDWPSNQEARDILALAGYTPEDAIEGFLDGTIEWETLASEAAKDAIKAINQLQSEKGLDITAPAPEGVKKQIAKMALELRRAEKDGETVTAGNQSKADHVIQLIEKHLASWSQADKDRVQAALNGAKS